MWEPREATTGGKTEEVGQSQEGQGNEGEEEKAKDGSAKFRFHMRKRPEREL